MEEIQPPRNKFFIVEINSRKIATLKGFIEEFKREFRFPDYFGGGLDSFNDCMRDLSWLDEKNYLIILKKSKKIKKNRIIFDYKKSLDFIKEYWDNQRQSNKRENGFFIIEYES